METPPKKPSPIHLLPPELLTTILTHLTRIEAFPLLFVSRHFYKISYPKIWHTLSTSAQEHVHGTHFYGQRHGLRKLVDYSRNVGLENIKGFKHTKEIIFNGDEDFGYFGIWASSGLLEFLAKLVEIGDINLRRLQLQRSDRYRDIWEGTPAMSNFLKTIKHHSTATVSICARYSSDYLYLPLELFAPERITSLDLIHHRRPEPHVDGQKVTITNVTTLISILEQTRCLRSSVLGTEYTIDDQPELEQRLQNAVLDLSNLHTLKIIDLLFHPTFFLTLPDTIQVLTIVQGGSIPWWQQFAQCTFPNLQDLTIFSPPISQSTKIRFTINQLELRTLKRLSTNCYLSTCCPRDFLDLMLLNNQGIDESDRMHYEEQNKVAKDKGWI